MKTISPDVGKVETLAVVLNKLYAMKVADVVSLKQIAKGIKESEQQVSQWVMQRSRIPKADVAFKMKAFAAKMTIYIATNRPLQPRYRAAYQTATLKFPEGEK